MKKILIEFKVLKYKNFKLEINNKYEHLEKKN